MQRADVGEWRWGQRRPDRIRDQELTKGSKATIGMSRDLPRIPITGWATSCLLSVRQRTLAWPPERPVNCAPGRLTAHRLLLKRSCRAIDFRVATLTLNP